MCGLTGLIDLSKATSADQLTASVRRMNNTITHRGPDSEGIWVDEVRGVALGHRRLSIIDLSPSGQQPMLSANDRYVIAYNGEIYNFKQIRAELEKSGEINWRGSSDTEVLLAAIVRFGVHQAVQKCEGMFAFALYDRAEHQLYLARDRIGEKPLFYGVFGKKLVFGSSLAGFEALGSLPLTIDKNALTLMMRHNHIPAPYSIYQHVSKLKPGTIARFELNSKQSWLSPQLTAYWRLADQIPAGSDRLVNEEQAIRDLETLLNGVVSDAMVSDVPIGAFLSGGVDSSLITALMQANSSSRINTFSIGFKEDAFSEAAYARQVAEHLGTHHTELYLSGQDALDVIPNLAAIYDEPFSDSSQIPTYLVSKMAREHVTVALSGDGGDELFCGYNRYLFGDNIRKKLAFLPLPARRWLAKGLRTPTIDQWNGLYQGSAKILGRKPGLKNLGDKIYKASDVIASKSERELYRRLVSHWKFPGLLIPGASEYKTELDGDVGKGLGFIESMMALDTVSYLPDDILVKVDRAAMYNSLETRVPFLNHRVVEFAWSLPLAFKLKGANGKYPLKQILYKHVPKKLIDRPKMGFGVPLGQWLRHDLRDWAEDLLAPDRLQEQHIFDVAMVRNCWADHLSGRTNHQYYLWDILIFQAWLKERQPGYFSQSDRSLCASV
ncbi:MAG: asparagine synthase (glutamine-hydrolyzing) [Gammaproteobacteria bacterium]|nr:asparagine synthase (glutamine-hydrolyzing) [Gammaproteobacteria bacterium]